MGTIDASRPSSLRTAAWIALIAALVVQTIWFATQGFSDVAFSELRRSLIFTAAFWAVALTRGRERWINALGRFVIAGAFLLALWNRFDNFAGFIRYTGVVNSFLPESMVPAIAVLATIAEVTCCVLMFVGLKLRLASAMSGLLLFSFATAMTLSGLEQFTWAVYVLATGGFMLATVDASPLSVDSYLKGRGGM